MAPGQKKEPSMKKIVEIYYVVDEAVKQIEQKFGKKFAAAEKISLKSELLTMALIGHFDDIGADKKLYEYIAFHLNDYFKNLLCYEQFS